MTFRLEQGALIPEGQVRRRARLGRSAAFPDLKDYAKVLFGGRVPSLNGDVLDAMRIVPPVFMPQRLEKLIDLGREPLHTDVDLRTSVGGFAATIPCYISAFGSTQAADARLCLGLSVQSAQLGIPLVLGENVFATNGYGRLNATDSRGLLDRIRAYTDHLEDDQHGAVIVQQSTEDADSEVWNLVYSDPSAVELLNTGRLGFELKVGQGAKPGLGGMSVVKQDQVASFDKQFLFDNMYGEAASEVTRFATPGTFTEEILTQQVRLMRNNYPRARVWIKLPPGRDIAEAAGVAWAAGADAVTVDGAEGGTGWAPNAALNTLGLPLAECIRRIGLPAGPLMMSGGMWEGTRAVKCLALGARAIGLGRAALLAVDEDIHCGLIRLIEALTLELQLLVSSLGKYSTSSLTHDDLHPQLHESLHPGPLTLADSEQRPQHAKCVADLGTISKVAGANTVRSRIAP